MIPVALCAALAGWPVEDAQLPFVHPDDALAFGCTAVEAERHWHASYSCLELVERLRFTGFRNHDEYAAALAEANWTRQCWSKLDDVLRLSPEPREKIRHLMQLRHLLGFEAYTAGRMPRFPHVPDELPAASAPTDQGGPL